MESQKENGEVQSHEDILGHESEVQVDKEDMEIEETDKEDEIEEDEGKQEQIGAEEAQEIVLALMGCHCPMDMEEDVEDIKDLSDHLEDMLDQSDHLEDMLDLSDHLEDMLDLLHVDLNAVCLLSHLESRFSVSIFSHL